MYRALESLLPDQPPEAIRRRAFGIAMAIAIHLLALLLFLLSPPIDLKKLEPEVRNFTLLSLSDANVAPKPKPRASATQTKKKAVETPPPPELPPALPSPLKMMIVGRDVFAASDISRMPSHSAAGAPSTSDSNSAGNDDAPGEGPGGEKLYNPDWYREPTDAEMAYYMPKGGPRAGWALIACRTIANFQVEDCRELAESPAGSGLARAVRQAAWQFRIRPPRIGGKPLIGAWVRIRYEMSVGITK